jgi:hypothetical protein
LEVFEGLCEAGRGRWEFEQRASPEEFGFGHDSRRASSGLVHEVVPGVDVVLPKGSEVLEDVVGGGVGLGVDEGSSVVQDRRCGSS